MRISDWSSDVCSSDLHDPGNMWLRSLIAECRADHQIEARQVNVMPGLDAVKSDEATPSGKPTLALVADRKLVASPGRACLGRASLHIAPDRTSSMPIRFASPPLAPSRLRHSWPHLLII